MDKKERPYIFHSFTRSLCPECMKVVDAKIVLEDNKVLIMKKCPTHGLMKTLLEDDVEFFQKQDRYDKPGTICKTQTVSEKGCPHDCGLCTGHEQHTCIGLIEVTNQCNLKCPVCYARADNGVCLSLENIEKMMDFYQDSEFGNAEILQLSGGEPTVHPEIIDIIKLSKEKKFKYVMLNTHGLRFAKDLEFVKELSKFKEGFEIYLQFDGFKKETYEYFRGRDLLEEKKKAIENLTAHKIPITLVSTIEKGINDDEIGDIVEYGLSQKYVRGINFQPVAYFGRMKNVDGLNRITRTGILKNIESQTGGMIKKSDFLPLPCHPERVAFTFLYRKGDEFIPVTRGLDTEKYVPYVKNTFNFVPEDFLKKVVGGTNTCCSLDIMKALKPMIPISYFAKSKEKKKAHIDQNTFRISISSFIDAYNFDMKSMKKECVHIITPDLKKIPFSAYNMIYREAYEKKFYKK